MHFTTKGFPTIYKSISHWSHPPNLSVVLLTHLNLWMSPVKYSLRQISMTYLHHTKIPRANIRHAWISKEMKTGPRKDVGWGKKDGDVTLSNRVKSLAVFEGSLCQNSTSIAKEGSCTPSPAEFWALLLGTGSFEASAAGGYRSQSSRVPLLCTRTTWKPPKAQSCKINTFKDTLQSYCAILGKEFG